MLIKALNEKKKKFLFLRKTFPSLRVTSLLAWRMMLTDYNLWHLVKEEKQEHNFWINGNLIHFDSLDDPAKKKSSDWNYIFFEEMNDFSLDDFKTMQMYNRAHPGPDGVKYEVFPGVWVHVRNQIYGMLNPVDANCFVKAELLDKSAYDTEEIVSTYKDNTFLHKDTVKLIEGLKDQDHNYYLIYTCAEWGVLENIIYSNWHIIKQMNLPNERQIDETVYGLDFGYTNPSAMVRIDFADNKVYEQELFCQTHLKPDQLIEKVKMVVSDMHRDKYIYCDNAEPDTIQMLCDAGFNAHPADKDVRNGINKVKMQDIRITEDSVNLIKEKRGYCYKKDKDGNVREGEPVKWNDHLMDAERYAIYTYLKQFGQSDNEIYAGGSAVQ